MFGPVLRGDHVTLRPGDDSDPPRFIPWFADMEVTRYLGRRWIEKFGRKWFDGDEFALI